MFLGEVIGIPPRREIEFSIDITPRVVLISKSPYRMSTPKLMELIMQIHDLLEK